MTKTIEKQSMVFLRCSLGSKRTLKSIVIVFSVEAVQPFSREFVFNFKKKRMTDCTSVQSVINLIDKMSSGAGALKAEGRKGGIALEVTMATKRAPTSRHRHTERIHWNTYHNPYLPIQGWEELEQKPADITGRE